MQRQIMERGRGPEPRLYDPDSIEEIKDGLPVSDIGAVRIAATEMIGADETPDGILNATHTYCPELRAPHGPRPVSSLLDEDERAEAIRIARELGIILRPERPRRHHRPR